MKKPLPAVMISVTSFAAGVALAHYSQPVIAATIPLQPRIYDLGALTPADLATPNPLTPNLRSKSFFATDGMTAAVQIGTVFKHVHNETNELQIVIAGQGTEWLGNKRMPLKSGDLLVIPAGTPHGGTTDTAHGARCGVRTERCVAFKRTRASARAQASNARLAKDPRRRIKRRCPPGLKPAFRTRIARLTATMKAWNNRRGKRPARYEIPAFGTGVFGSPLA
jgi:hypothetical protein